jgi:putative PIN family toxin of toxin-antitoxin system
LFDEFRDVLSRPRIAKLIAPGEAEWLLTLLYERTLLVEPLRVERVCRDPDDNYLLALARTVDADYLVTRDEDLLTLRRFHNTEVIYPARFMQMLSQTGRR